MGAGSVTDMTQAPPHPATEAPAAEPAGQRVCLAEVAASVSAATALLRGAPAVLWQGGGTQLATLLGQVDELAALAAGVRVAITAEALSRGEIAASQCASTSAWVTAHAPSLGAGNGAGQLAALVEATHRKPALAPVREAVVAGELPVPVATVVLAEFAKLREQLVPEAHELVLDGLIRIGAQDGARQVRRLRTALLARYGAPDELQHEQDRAAALVGLSHPVCTDEGVWQYRFTADAEAKAILEAAIGVLSAPWHPDGAADPRTAQQRRGQALVEVCRRVTAAAKAAGVFGAATPPQPSPPPSPPPATARQPPTPSPPVTTPASNRATNPATGRGQDESAARPDRPEAKRREATRREVARRPEARRTRAGALGPWSNPR